MDQKLLNVGDNLYAIKYKRVLKTLTIDRVTPKRAYSGGYEFDRELDTDGRAHVRPQSSYSASYWLESEELKDRKIKEDLITEIENKKGVLNMDNLRELPIEVLTDLHKTIFDLFDKNKKS